MKNLLLIAIVVAVMFFVSTRPGGSWVQAILILAFTIPLVFALQWIGRKAVRRSYIVEDMPEGPFPSNVFAKALISAPREQVLNAVQTALRSLPHVDVQRVRITADNAIETRTKMRAVSWGEVVRVELSEIDGGTQVQLTSRPVLPTVTNDWAVNFQNVLTIVRQLRRQVSVQILDSNVKQELG